jgi:hypothetical protein
MANAICAKPLQGSVLRATLLDECGAPDYGECSYAVSDGFVSATLTPNSEEGERFLQRGANGVPIINQRGRPSLNWYDVMIQFQEVDPELFTLLTGLPPYLDDQGRTIGFEVTESDYATANFALELWLGNAEEECPDSGIVLPWYGYSLLPWLVEGVITEDIVVTNGMITFSVAGRTRKGNQWDTGPYDVVYDQVGTPSPLPTAIETDTHNLQIWTQLAPPVASCGCQELTS